MLIIIVTLINTGDSTVKAREGIILPWCATSRNS